MHSSPNSSHPYPTSKNQKRNPFRDISPTFNSNYYMCSKRENISLQNSKLIQHQNRSTLPENDQCDGSYGNVEETRYFFERNRNRNEQNFMDYNRNKNENFYGNERERYLLEKERELRVREELLREKEERYIQQQQQHSIGSNYGSYGNNQSSFDCAYENFKKALKSELLQELRAELGLRSGLEKKSASYNNYEYNDNNEMEINIDIESVMERILSTGHANKHQTAAFFGVTAATIHQIFAELHTKGYLKYLGERKGFRIPPSLKGDRYKNSKDPMIRRIVQNIQRKQPPKPQPKPPKNSQSKRKRKKLSVSESESEKESETEEQSESEEESESERQTEDEVCDYTQEPAAKRAKLSDVESVMDVNHDNVNNNDGNVCDAQKNDGKALETIDAKASEAEKDNIAVNDQETDEKH